MTLALQTATAEILSVDKRRVGTIGISLLPGYSTSTVPPPLLHNDGTESALPSGVLLLESMEYRYELELADRAPWANVTTDRREVFTADTHTGMTGRVRPGLFTGTMPVTVFEGSNVLGTFELEVRAKKLDYLSEYRWMLRDIAADAAELVMDQFAVAEQHFTVDFTTDPETLYQRFAFLRSLIQGEDIAAGLRRILTRPHIAWDELTYEQPPNKGWPVGSAAARELVRAKQRVVTPALAAPLDRIGVPSRITVSRTEATVDNVPNRFVKYALERWRDIVTATEERLRASGSPSAARGVRETAAVRDQLDEFLAEELFREVGGLSHFPVANQVLLKREGYRDIFRSYVLFEAAAKLAWSGGEDVYRAGQKNVAALYEYWTYMQLAKLLGELCDRGFDRASLVRLSTDGMTLDLLRGVERTLCGKAERLGRVLTIELWFNRTFPVGPQGSWTRPMRPDCSMLLTCEEGATKTFEPVLVHFDAKYRVETISELFEAAAAPDVSAEESNGQTALERGDTRRDDILKMHAYRDAIRRSAGAYVLYPGSEQKRYEEYHELLPGLGAFALRPTATQEVLGAVALKGFLNDVLSHVASQVSQHERGRFWRRRSYGDLPVVGDVAAAPFLNQPPADTQVLLGYVKNAAHARWIHDQKRYNLRADDRRGAVGLGHRALAADLLLLYSPAAGLLELWSLAGQPELVSKSEMDELEYPQARGRAYLCLTLEQDLSVYLPKRMSIGGVLVARERIAPAAPRGAPVATNWLELIRHTSED